jgi:hypothetical protein
MSRQVTVDLPDEVYRRAENLARLTSREVSDVLADAISLSLPSLDDHDTQQIPVRDRSDTELLALTRLQLPPDQDKRLSTLLQQQQARGLSRAERAELQTLMQLYERGLLFKAEALREAVRRGLSSPLES